MADPICVKRLNYFDHQFLRKNDFSDEQDYHLSRRRLHNKLLHTPGIAEGLEATIESGGSVIKIAAGVAIDKEGREVVHPGQPDYPLDDVHKNKPAGTTWFLTIQYEQEKTDDSTRWTEKPAVNLDDNAPPANSTKVVLAQVKRTANGFDIDPSPRKAAGVVVAGDLSVNSVTLKQSGVAAEAWPKLTCSGGAIHFLAGPELKERVKIDANGTLDVAQAMRVQKGATDLAGIYFWPDKKQRGFVGMPDKDTIGFWGEKIAFGLTMNTETGDTGAKTTLTVGPLALPPTTEATAAKTLEEKKAAGGRLAVTGKTAELAFVRRDLAKWPANEQPGDKFAWYNPDGKACLSTKDKGDLMVVDKDGKVSIGKLTIEPDGKMSSPDNFSFRTGAAPEERVKISRDGLHVRRQIYVKKDEHAAVVGFLEEELCAQVGIRSSSQVGFWGKTILWGLLMDVNDGNTIVKKTLTVGPFALPTAEGVLAVTGEAAELAFVRRSLKSWPATEAAGDKFAWYNKDGSACLSTKGNEHLIVVDKGGGVSIDKELIISGSDPAKHKWKIFVNDQGFLAAKSIGEEHKGEGGRIQAVE